LSSAAQSVFFWTDWLHNLAGLMLVCAGGLGFYAGIRTNVIRPRPSPVAERIVPQVV